ncbi:MAG: class I SAM-dependent methyltransferase [Solirubrobacteraceae bacterium]
MSAEPGATGQRAGGPAAGARLGCRDLRPRLRCPGGRAREQLECLSLEGDEPVDVIFSNATFHWISDHAKLFRALAGALTPDAAG